MSNERFTAWLSTEERDRIRQLAAEHECSENFIVRMAVRALVLGVPVPSYLKTEKAHQ